MLWSVHVGMVPNLVYLSVNTVCPWQCSFFRAEENRDGFVAVVCDISYMVTSRAKKSFGICAQCSAPTLALGATSGNSLVIPNLWGEQRRMIFPTFLPLLFLHTCYNSFWEFWFPLDVKESIFMLLCLPGLFRWFSPCLVKKEIFKKAIYTKGV